MNERWLKTVGEALVLLRGVCEARKCIDPESETQFVPLLRGAPTSSTPTTQIRVLHRRCAAAELQENADD